MASGRPKKTFCTGSCYLSWDRPTIGGCGGNRREKCLRRGSQGTFLKTLQEKNLATKRDKPKLKKVPPTLAGLSQYSSRTTQPGITFKKTKKCQTARRAETSTKKTASNKKQESWKKKKGRLSGVSCDGNLPNKNGKLKKIKGVPQ